MPLPRDVSPNEQMQMESLRNDRAFSSQSATFQETSNPPSRVSSNNFAPLPVDFTSYGSSPVSREQGRVDNEILLSDARKRSISDVTSGDEEEPDENHTQQFTPSGATGYHQYPPPSLNHHPQSKQDQNVQRSQYPSPMNDTTSLQQQSELSLSNPRASRFNSISALLNTEPHRDISQLNFGQEDRFVLTPNANHILPSKSRPATPSTSLAGTVPHSDVLDSSVSSAVVDSSGDLQPGQEISMEERRSRLRQDAERMKEMLRAKEKELEALDLIG